jgi:hypothetical protein
VTRSTPFLFLVGDMGQGLSSLFQFPDSSFSIAISGSYKWEDHAWRVEGDGLVFRADPGMDSTDAVLRWLSMRLK